MPKKIAQATRALYHAQLLVAIKQIVPHLANNELDQLVTQFETYAHDKVYPTKNIHMYRKSQVDQIYQYILGLNHSPFAHLHEPVVESVNPLYIPADRLQQLGLGKRWLLDTELNQQQVSSKAPLPEDEELKILGVTKEMIKLSAKQCGLCDGPARLKKSKQMRSADEPETQFFICTRCKHEWREG